MKDGKHVVLCIDDDSDVLEFLRAVLENAGYVMAEALSAEEGLAVFKQEQPDLVIVDLMMEEVDAGKTLVQDIKALQSQVPIYMLSSVGDSLSQHVDFQDLGLLGVFQKPIDPETLIATLKAKLS